MAINFPDSPTDRQTYTDSGTGQTWTYELATNSWTASSLAVTGGVVYKGGVDITAAPPTGVKAGEQWSVDTGGTANAGYGPGVTGTINKGDMVMYTGTGWLQTSYSLPNATTGTKGVDTLKWNRTGTVLSPATAGDDVNIGGTKIALKAADGSATFAGNVQAPNFVFGDRNTKGAYHIGLTNSGAFSTNSGHITFEASTGGAENNIYYKIKGAASIHQWDGSNGKALARLNDAGNFLLGGSLATKPSISLNENGTANFAANASGTADTFIVSASQNGTYQGQISYDSNAGLSGYAVDFAGQTPVPVKWSLKRDGSATFAAGSAKILGTGEIEVGDGAVNGGWRVFVSDSGSPSQRGRMVFRSKAGGSGEILQAFSGTGETLRIYANGNIQNISNSYGALSDLKLKENIVDASSQWDDLKALQVRNYNFKEGQTHTQIGLVAQEAELVSPGLVSESPDRDEDGSDLGTVTKSVNYSVLYMKAVKALQEAMERIETLEAKVTALETP